MMKASLPIRRVAVFTLVCLIGPPIALAGEQAEPALAAQLKRAGENRGEIERALSDVPSSQRAGMEFLVKWMPARDLQQLSGDFLLENVRLAYAARAQAGWEINESLFFNDVLPYAVASEARHPWRADFWQRFGPRVAHCKTPGEAALVLNRTVFDELKVHYNTRRQRADQSPHESQQQGRASCTGLSIILIDACRAVGVPARMAGVANWSDNRGNHTWVEVWDAGGWHFVGADEPDERGLNHAWFVADAGRADAESVEHAIWATSWRQTGHQFPLSFAPHIKDVHAVNVTARYVSKASASEDELSCRVFVKMLNRTTGERVARSVGLVTKPAGPESEATIKVGVTRHHRADLNDMLTFKLPRGSRADFRAWWDGRLQTGQVEVPDAATHTVTLETSVPPDPMVAARQWFEAVAPERPLIPLDKLQQQVELDDAAAREIVWEAYRAADIHDTARQDFEQGRVTAGEHSSPYLVKEVGQRPAAGWPLVIAMHGGGAAPQELNDSQWRHMHEYYKEHPEVSGYKYLALRAPNNEWNGFYADYVYPLIDRLISNFALFGDVDRDRVYLLGYSHGGYGAFAIGPKMPDRFAAIHASAAAPTDGETSAKTLRTTRFTHMIGEHDEAHGRNWRNRRFAEQIAELKGDREDIYPVEMLWKDGYGHGGLPDRDYLPQLLTYTRNPVPREVLWAQTDEVIQRFFWLADKSPAKGREVLATCRGNRVTLRSETIPQLDLLLDARLVRFDQPVEIVTGTTTATQQLVPSAQTLLETLEETDDKGRAATCRLTIDLIPDAH